MDAISTIMGRKVAREFLDRPVAPEALRKIADAGRHAMSARNLQPWRFIVLTERETLRALGELCTTGRFVGQAPAAIAVLKEVANARWADIDCAQAVQNMANAAWAMGLGTCWVGNFDRDKIAALLDVPSQWGVFTILPFGYPPNGAAQPRPLKPRTETVFAERFGKSVSK
ncbi:MAG TPA: nitroreductase family protein [Candidatus Binataceae bacterium]|jgi:nitroreductase